MLEENRKKKIVRISSIVAVLHAVSVTLAAFAITDAQSKHPTEECALLWYVFVLIDAPVSLVGLALYPLLWRGVAELGQQVQSIYVPAVFFGVAGSIQYFTIVYLILWLRETRRVKILSREGRCSSCGYDLRGLHEQRCPECGTQAEQKNHTS